MAVGPRGAHVLKLRVVYPAHNHVAAVTLLLYVVAQIVALWMGVTHHKVVLVIVPEMVDGAMALGVHALLLAKLLLVLKVVVLPVIIPPPRVVELPVRVLTHPKRAMEPRPIVIVLVPGARVLTVHRHMLERQ